MTGKRQCDRIIIEKQNLKKGGVVMNLVDRILRYRATEGISQQEFAKRCGLSTQTINSIENKLQSPTKLTETKIVLVLEERGM